MSYLIRVKTCLWGFFRSEFHKRTRRPQPPGRIQIALWIVLLSFSFLLSTVDFDSFQLGAYEDDSIYAVLAHSLIHSNHYGLTNMPCEPDPTRYPFGYPLLLTPFVLLFPDQPDAMKIPSLLATLLNITLLFWGWRWFSCSTSHWWGLAITALYAFSPLTIGHTRMVMSEPIFTTFCLSALLLAEWATASELNPRNRLLFIMLTSITLFFAVFIRTIGLVLLISVFTYLLAASKLKLWKQLAMVLGGVASLVLTVIALTPIEYNDLVPSEYMNQFTSPSVWDQNAIEEPLIPRFISSSTEYLKFFIRQTVVPVGTGQSELRFAQQIGLPYFPVFFGFLISGIVGLGLVTWFLREGISSPLFFALFYFGAVVLWPWRDSRFLYPIQPQLFLGLLLGMATILLTTDRLFFRRQFLPSLANIAIAVLVLVLLVLSVYKTLNIDDSRLHVGNLEARSAWLKSNIPPTAVVMTEQPQTDFLYARRKTVPYRGLESAAELRNYLDRNNVDFILVAPKLIWQSQYVPVYSNETMSLLSLLQEFPSAAEIVYESQEVKIFRVDR